MTDTANEKPAPPRLAVIGFALVALTLLAAQVVLSRLFAGIMSYYYAFMLVSLAMLGLASGGLIVQMAPRWFPVQKVWLQSALFSLGLGISGFVGTMALLDVARNMDFGSPTNHYVTSDHLGLAMVFWCIFPLFLCGGFVVSLVLSHSREHFHRLYAADLSAAALGCLLAILLLISWTPVEAMLKAVAILPLAAACLFALADRRRGLALGSLALTVTFALLGSLLGHLDVVRKPNHLSWSKWPKVVDEWNAVSSVRVHPDGRFFTWSLSGEYRGPTFRLLTLLIDGIGGTQIVQFDGEADSLRDYQYLDYDLPFLGHLLTPKGGRQLVIGPGGGVDLLQAVRAGKRDITAVEINPLVERVVNEELAGFSGRPYELPGVAVVIDNGRTFIKRSREKWDLITMTWVDTGGSPTALAMSENYLYTVEAFEEFLQHLEPDGLLAFLRALGSGTDLKIDSMRGVAVAVEALQGLGVDEPGKQLVVAASFSPFFNRAMCYVLVKRTSFTDEEVSVAREYLDRMGFEPIWLPGGGPEAASVSDRVQPFAEVIRGIITSPDRDRLYREAPFDILPTTDDNPFYFVERAGAHRAAGAGVRDLWVSLGILISLVVPVLFLPLIGLVRKTRSLGMPGVAALSYFSLIGLAFMLVEIELFHVFALVLGSPTVTLATVLASLLVFSGLGSLQGNRVASAPRWVLAVHFTVLAGLLFLFAGFKDVLLSALVVQTMPLRVLGTMAVIAPIGFVMGVPMPAGIRLVRERPDVLLWGWALNGAFSVLASVLAIYLAIHIGISHTYVLGALGYLAAGGLIQVFKVRALPA